MSYVVEIADALSRAKIAKAVGVSRAAVTNALSRGRFPSGWFPIIDEMARESGVDCPREAFNFRTPSHRPSREASNA